ncbi:hypothetical protein T01_12629 [Trichinella spiralis]|uniref:FLYWCH-type domain-containing protein n=1 Tax=Trichinella spiralis TaxID=6334 RepID=A0A0V1BYR0_TRISP|nr:hypothetical protein T01_12629 [Trichinella spiralis]
MEANNDLIQFVTTTKNQQKLVVYSGRCYTLKRTKCNDKYWMCTERSRSCCGTLSTNLEATEVIRSSDHAESCPVTPPPPAFYHHQQLAELRRLASENIRDRRDTQCTTVGPENTHAYRQLGSELQLTAEHTTINPTNNHLEGWHNCMTKRARKHHLGFYQFLQLIIDEQGKTETVVQQMDDDYTRERGFVRCNAAYRVPQRWVEAS